MDIPFPRSRPDDLDRSIRAWPLGPVRSPAHADRRHHLLDVDLHVFPSPQAAALDVLGRGAGAERGVGVFTCNVDHVMLMSRDRRFRDAYSRADVVTIDGAPLALLSRWTGTSAARRVTGVDLTVALLGVAAEHGLRVALVGGAPGRADQAAANIRGRVPELPEMLVRSPRMGFATGDDEDLRLVEALREYAPSIVIVCLGAPKQELWIDLHRADLPGAVLVGAGATIDYLSGDVARAPGIFQRTGTEAFYRLTTEFPRLWRRYLVRDSRFVIQFARTIAHHVADRTGLTDRHRSHPAQMAVRAVRPGRSCAVCTVSVEPVPAPCPDHGEETRP